MEERVHVVGLVLHEDVHGDIDALCYALVGEDLVCRVVVGWYRWIKTVETPRCYEDGSVRHRLGRGVPTGGGELVAWFTPRLAVQACIGR